MDELLRTRFAFQDLLEHGDRPALHLRVGPAAGHRSISYRELAGLAGRIAAELAARGCRPGERVALLMPHGHRLIALFFGAIHGGAVPSILAWPTAKMDPEKYRRNLLAVVAGLSAEWLVTDRAMAATLGAAVGQARVIDASAFEPAFAGDGPTAEPRLGDGDPLFIQFSGGTTGTQKSVPIGAGKLLAQLAAYREVLALDRDDCIISWLPLYHDMGLVACLLLPFVERLPVSLFAPMEWVMDPGRFLATVAQDRATLAWLPNFAFSFMAAKARLRQPVNLASLRALINCSEPVRAESVDAFVARFAAHGLRPEAMHACYAMAEATFAVTQTLPDDPPRRLRVGREALGRGRIEPREDGERVLVSCGRPIAGVDVRVVDEQGRDCHGAIGEIWLRGEFVMDDYLPSTDRPARWAFAGEWYRTGDLGALYDGHLFVTGRKKDVIIVGGINVFPEDLEAAVSAIDGIHAGRVVAMGMEDELAGTERLVLAAEVDDEAAMARAEALEESIRAAVVLTCGVAPHTVLVVPPRWIVKSTAGKISRSETRERVRRHLGEKP